MSHDDPFDPSGPATAGGVFGLPTTEADARVVLLPVPWEATTSYGRGTARGPSAILSASAQVDLFDHHNQRPYEAGIHMLDEAPDIVAWNAEACEAALPIIDAGGVPPGDAELGRALDRVNQLSRRMSEWVCDTTRALLERGKIVGVVGGDHSTPLGAIRAHCERLPGLGILHFDAHADLREAYEGFVESHASIMFNVLNLTPSPAKLVQVGVRDYSEEERALASSDPRVKTFYDVDLASRLFAGEPFATIADEIVAELPDDVYVSFDVDGLDPALCPHTGTPVPGGRSFHEVCFVLDRVVASGRRLVGFDLVEVSPGSGDDEWDANVGARLLYKLVGFTLRAQTPGARPHREEAAPPRRGC